MPGVRNSIIRLFRSEYRACSKPVVNSFYRVLLHAGLAMELRVEPFVFGSEGKVECRDWCGEDAGKRRQLASGPRGYSTGRRNERVTY